MKILSAIKSLQSSSRWFQRHDQEEDSVLFGITRQEAASRIQNVVSAHVVKLKAQASDNLRAMLSHPTNGEKLPKDYQIQVGDVLVVAAKEFKEGFQSVGPHGMIVVVTSLEPFTCNMYELTHFNRNELSLRVGKPIQTNSDVNMAFILSSMVEEERLKRYLDRNLVMGTLFKVKLEEHHIFKAFCDTVEKLQTQRRKLSKYDNCENGYFYGNYRCNNLVHDVVKLALEMR